jgi:hypothetical protein
MFCILTSRGSKPDICRRSQVSLVLMDSRLDSLSLPVVRTSGHASDLDMGSKHDPSYPVVMLIHHYFEWVGTFESGASESSLRLFHTVTCSYEKRSPRLHSRDRPHTPCVYTRQHGKTRRPRLFGSGDESRDNPGYSMIVLAWFIHGSESPSTIWLKRDGTGNRLTGTTFVKMMIFFETCITVLLFN